MLTETLTGVAAGVVDFCDEGCRVLVLGFSFEYGGGGRPADLAEVFGGLEVAVVTGIVVSESWIYVDGVVSLMSEEMQTVQLSLQGCDRCEAGVLRYVG